MDDIIQKIIDSEMRAQQIVKSARDERHAHETMMRAELEAYRQKTADDTKDRIARFADQQKRDADTGVKHSADAARIRIVQLQQTAAQNRDGWIEHLYHRILDGGVG